MRHVGRIAGVATACMLALGSQARGQANVPQFRGDYGLGSGTLPPPGSYLGFLYNDYRADQVNGIDGTVFPNLKPTVDVAALLASYTFPQSILGGHYAVAAAVPWTTVGLETVNLDLEGKWGYSDMYVQPLKLGWSFPAADVVTGFGLYMPTGRFHADALNNNGFGMWSYEGTAGTTLHIGPSRQGSVSTLLTYQIQSKIKDTDRRAGQLLTLEGGAGYSILKDIGQIGLVYYAQWKTTSDQGFTLPPAFDGRSQSFGLGPEVTIPFPVPPVTGIVTLRYYIELGNRVAPQGDSFFVTLTLHQPSRPK